MMPKTCQKNQFNFWKNTVFFGKPSYFLKKQFIFGKNNLFFEKSMYWLKTTIYFCFFFEQLNYVGKKHMYALNPIFIFWKINLLFEKPICVLKKKNDVFCFTIVFCFEKTNYLLKKLFSFEKIIYFLKNQLMIWKNI